MQNGIYPRKFCTGNAPIKIQDKSKMMLNFEQRGNILLGQYAVWRKIITWIYNKTVISENMDQLTHEIQHHEQKDRGKFESWSCWKSQGIAPWRDRALASLAPLRGLSKQKAGSLFKYRPELYGEDITQMLLTVDHTITWVTGPLLPWIYVSVRYQAL